MFDQCLTSLEVSSDQCLARIDHCPALLQMAVSWAGAVAGGGEGVWSGGVSRDGGDLHQVCD